MRSMKVLGLCFIAAMAMSAVASTSASAKNPRWAVCNPVAAGTGNFTNAQCTTSGKGNWEAKELGAGETKGFTIEENGAQKLSVPAAGITIKCEKVRVDPGAQFIGGEPGTDQEQLLYTECKVEGHAECRVNSPGRAAGEIQTNVLKSRLAYKTKAAEETENQEETVTVLAPQTGEVFVPIELKTCPVEGVFEVKGEVAGENVKGGEHLVTHELNFPETAIKVYWVQTAEQKPKEEIVKQLKFGLFNATYVGKVKVKLTDGQDWWIV